MQPTQVKTLAQLRSRINVELVTSALQITWYRPTRNIWIECKSLGQATQVLDVLHNIVVRDITLRCCLCSTETSGRLSVQITNAIESIDGPSLLAMLPEAIRAVRKITFGPLSYGPDISAIDVMTKKISNAPNLKVAASALLITKNQLKRRALLMFGGSPNLDMLAKNLNGQRHAELGNTRVFVAETLQVVVTTDHYEFLRHKKTVECIIRRFQARGGIKASHDANKRSKSSDRVVRLTITGGDREVVQDMKAEIDALFINDMASLLQYLQQPKPVGTHRIRLTKTSNYRAVIKGGLQKAQELYGSDIVKLDDTGDVPAVIIVGGTPLLRPAQRALFSSLEAVQPSILLRCESCWDSYEEVQMVAMPSCGHKCCKDCFEGYCTAAAEADIPIECFWPACSALVPSKLIFIELAETETLQIAQRAINDLFRKHAETYAQCQGPSCQSYYALNSDADTHTCPRCFTINCTKCRAEQHVGETCEEYKERRSDHQQALEAWMAKSGAKRCPNCATIIEKYEGTCNNMECTQCRVHICWKCMQTFTSHGGVYAHLIAEHRSWWDDPADAIDVQALQDEV
ncbi:hypothetical protein KC327_g15786 [Hortaea werneckii]|nr:hypothetical protein KC358_g15329 [Hortaea werneckii]KAI6811219.1 hypothetical protein KC350_g12292 [Hortaea werneckii]KAI6818082.1 hypothetical protein KC342_g14683 [Hortaea werneckii]KAI6916588.1 hypothetical protein KC348_g11488 [Hortaea werneckii]KAI6926241.1 hypothetical protein KC341_g12897 [Hortaea werneckii]